jgi:CRISPR/Cas system-associated exonuclease Cas4 (RecB family)
LVGGGSVPVLSASEIGTFMFCPEAWYLQRRGAARSAADTERLAAGRHAHRRLGAQTERLRALNALRGFTLAAIVLVLTLVAWQLLGSIGRPSP